MSNQSSATTSGTEMVVHSGQCHCGLVKIAFEGPLDIEFHECDCSMCYILGIIGLDIPKSRLVKFEGEEHLRVYQFNKKIAKHYFCEGCGASPLHVPRSNPEGYNIHFRCLDKSTLRSYKIVPFDGQNWEETIEKGKAARDEALQKLM